MLEVGADVAGSPGAGHGGRVEMADLMILVAAVAFGIAWSRFYVVGYLLPQLGTKGALPQRYVLAYVLAALPMLACWSVGIYLCELRRSDWSIRRGMRRAATLAPSMITAAVLVNVAFILLVRTIGLMVPGWDTFYRLAKPNEISYVFALERFLIECIA